ncbi:2-isopropylmalate synthase [Treponema primitia]|uniref:LeuA family protein n=1 Tax=Treponema primitia TaxID=88058 RepID=UPI0039809737
MNSPAKPFRRITVFDTTLREGDQAAGFAFTPAHKLNMARALAAAGVDIIETGFPLSNQSDFAVCRQAACELAGRTAVMCRCIPEEIRRSAEVFAGGVPGVLHLSLPVSNIHITAKLQKTETEILAMVRETVSFAAGLVSRVEMGAEDASRADRTFLREYCETALDAGAHIINIADTLGLFAPEEIRDLILFLHKKIPRLNSDATGSGPILSVHCHNDLGLACANTLAALEAGCGQAEVSVMGLGERAGNAALEELAANLAARPELHRTTTGILPEKLGALIRLSSEAMGSGLSPMKPLCGWNTRAHGSGIHQQGLMKNAETYSPALLERWSAVPERIVLSRHSGQSGVALLARRFCALELDDTVLARICAHLKDEAFSGTLGITEFLCLISDMKLLPPDVPKPLVCRAFSETLTDDGTASRVRINAAVAAYGSREPEQELTGEGATAAEATLATLRSIHADSLGFRQTVLNGYGDRVHLYTEITTTGTAGEEKLYAIERTGTSPALLLIRCCLDVINANR